MRVLVTGATGYVGGRLIPQLLAAGHEVVCLVRHPGSLDERPWRSQIEVREGDLVESDDIDLSGVDIAYYLVHSIGEARDFGEMERRAAANFLAAAERHRVSRIVYLGGLGRGELSHHLASRQEVGKVLASGSIQVIELRAAVVIGAGSLSFELLRHLTEVLPVMTTPRWVRTRCQPIAIADVLDLLQKAAEENSTESRVVEIGGPDVLTYEEMMRSYARAAGLWPRLIIPVPVLSPGLSSLWIGLVTPVPAATARPLVSSLRNEVTVAGEDGASMLGRDPLPFAEALKAALRAPDESDPATAQDHDPEWTGRPRFGTTRTAASTLPARQLASRFHRIGGETGYFGLRWAWRLRGALDRLFGGPGMRGRTDPDRLTAGDTVDFWRVAVSAPHLLELLAEMKLPGEGRLRFEAVENGSGSQLVQTTSFRPRGLLGRIYWLVMMPIHRLVLGRMARAIAKGHP